MKKVVVLATIICAVAFAHAGTVKWNTVAMYNANDAKVKDTANVYVYLLESQAAYDGLTDVWATFGDRVKNSGEGADGFAKSGKYNNLAVVSTSASANQDYYAVVIATIGTGDSMVYYAEKATVTAGDDGNGLYQFGVGALDSAAAAKTAWTSATAPITPPSPGSDPSGIPEPTSGLLLMMGGALLVLRRKQK